MRCEIEFPQYHNYFYSPISEGENKSMISWTIKPRYERYICIVGTSNVSDKRKQVETLECLT